MRLTHIFASHYLSHRNLNIEIKDDTRVLVVCGDNGTGKTGVAQGIRMALTGAPPRGLAYKNQLPELITQGEREGSFGVAVDQDGTLLTYRISLRTGNYSSSSPEPKGNTLPLDPEQFMALGAADRRKLLFGLAGIELKAEVIVRDLIDRGHTLDHVQAITPALRSGGFDGAAKAAKEEASQARGAWKLTTGENYGEKKAEGWRAARPVAPVNAAHALAIEEVVDGLQADLEKAKRTHEQLRAAAQANLGAADLRIALDELPMNQHTLTHMEQQREAIADQLEKARHAAQHKGGQTCPCPKCGEVLFWTAAGTLQAWEKAKPAMNPPEAARELTRLQNEQGEHARKLEDMRKKVAKGMGAQAVLATLPANPEAGAVRDAENRVQDLYAKLAIAQADLKLAKDASAAMKEAEDKTDKAATLHADVLAYEKLSDTLTELPAKYLGKAIQQVQQYLDQAAAAFGVAVTLREDMDLYYGTIRYGMASESQQWRLRAAIGYALAIIGGLQVVVLDGFDKVAVKDRGAILKWLGYQQEVQVVLCATLKEPPKLPEPPFQVAWIEAAQEVVA